MTSILNIFYHPFYTNNYHWSFGKVIEEFKAHPAFPQNIDLSKIECHIKKDRIEFRWNS